MASVADANQMSSAGLIEILGKTKSCAMSRRELAKQSKASLVQLYKNHVIKGEQPKKNASFVETLTDKELRAGLIGFNKKVGPINNKTRGTLQKKYLKELEADASLDSASPEPARKSTKTTKTVTTVTTTTLFSSDEDEPAPVATRRTTPARRKTTKKDAAPASMFSDDEANQEDNEEMDLEEQKQADQTLRAELRRFSVTVGPLNDRTRGVHTKKLAALQAKSTKEETPALSRRRSSSRIANKKSEKEASEESEIITANTHDPPSPAKEEALNLGEDEENNQVVCRLLLLALVATILFVFLNEASDVRETLDYLKVPPFISDSIDWCFKTSEGIDFGWWFSAHPGLGSGSAVVASGSDAVPSGSDVAGTQ